MLLLDLDPQAQSTTSFGLDRIPIEETIFSQLLYKEFFRVPLTHIAVPVAENLMLVPSTPISLEREKALVSAPNSYWHLKVILDKVKEKFDYVVIDSPPTLGVLTHSALVASDIALLAIETSFLALHGVSQMLELVHQLDGYRKTPLQIMALATLYDRRTKLAKEVLKDMQDYFQEKMLSTVIHHSTALREAAGFGKPITTYARRSRGCSDYLQLAEEVLERTLGSAVREGRAQMNPLALASHLYGEGSRTLQLLRGLGVDSMVDLESLTARRLSQRGHMAIHDAKRFLDKALEMQSVEMPSLPIQMAGDMVLAKNPKLNLAEKGANENQNPDDEVADVVQRGMEILLERFSDLGETGANVEAGAVEKREKEEGSLVEGVSAEEMIALSQEVEN